MVAVDIRASAQAREFAGAQNRVGAMAIRKILIVDDSPTERHVLNDMLTKSGYEVVASDNGEDAILKAKSLKPDLILMDVVMPGLNGFQATRAISRDPETKAIPVII
jgi:twitching motility two-component system response regulator PilH